MTATPPNSATNTSPVASAWTDTMSLDTLNEAIRLNGPSTAQQSTNTQRFWSTPARAVDSSVREVLQIDLGTERVINKISFDVAIFPQDISIEYYDADSKSWGPVLDGTVSASEPVFYTVLDSNPAVLPPISSVSGHLHPQHSFSGHWRPLDFSLKPVNVRSIRIILARTSRGTAPVNPFGVPTPYSLAVRNLYLGYSIKALSDVPYTLPTPNSTQRTDFAQTTDMFGSVVSFSVRVNSASNVLRENSNDINALTTVWKSQPQPIPWAVVNFYLDARDTDGNGQVLDRIFVDPLYAGPTTNLYYSNDEPDTSFPAPSDPLPTGVATVNNGAGVPGDVLHSGLPGKNAIAFVDISNQAIAFDASRPWWVGGRLRWKFNHGTQTGNNPIFDCGEFNISQTPFGLRLASAYGDTLNVTLDPFDSATPMSFVVSYDGTTYSMWVRVGIVDYENMLPVSVPLKPGSKTLRVGGFLGTDPGIGNFDLDAFVVKVDTQPDATQVNEFLNDPSPYVTASTFMGENDPRTDNGLLRYSPSFVTMDWPTGFLGGTPDRYSEMTWTPVTRDYVLRKGYMYFSPTRGKYWKLEFTNLSPQFYEVYQPVARTVETFPASMWSTSLQTAMSAATFQEMMPGVSNSYVVNAMTNSLDFGTTAKMSSGGTAGLFTNTMARVLQDSNVRKQLGGTYWAWNFLPLHSTGPAPSFQAQAKHTYEIVNYQQSSKLAYFVGLRTVTAYRLDYLVTDDTPQIVDLFHDTSGIDENTNWVLAQDHQLSSGAATYAEVRSKPINTNRVLTGVQFATQQTDPIALLAVDDFKDPALATWEVVGDAVLTSVTSTNKTLGKTVRIDRSLPPLTWSQIESFYPNYSAFAAGGLTFDAVQRGTQVPSESGGITSQPFPIPGGGRIYVAGRVMAAADLTSPLYVQLYDDATATVVAENAIDVKANKITEWYAGYTINEAGELIPFRWQDFAPAPVMVPLNDSFVRPVSTNLGVMDSGQQWSWPFDNFGNPMSLAIQGNTALVTTAGQQDYVDTGNPWGTLQFSVGTMGSSSSTESMLVRIGTVFLDDAGVLNNVAGAPFSGTRGNVLTTNQTARAVQAGDTIRVDIMPTHLVPAGKADVSLAGGTDNTLVPYSVLFYLNGTWVRTLSHNLGVDSIMALAGRPGQVFTSFKWTPAAYGAPVGDAITQMPRVGSGAWLDSTTQTTWVSSEGNRTWTAPSGAWNASTAAPVGFDTFTRSSASGWSTADTGQTYSLIWTNDGGGGLTDVVVNGSAATMTVRATNNYKIMVMNVSLLATNVQTTASVPFGDVTGTGNIEIAGCMLRYNSGANNYYLVRPEILPNETVGMTIRKVISGSETVLATLATVSGVTWSAGAKLRVRADISGTGVISGKVWLDGTTEPASYQLTFTDTSITAAGAIGIRGGVASGNTNTLPIVFTYDNLVVTGNPAPDNVGQPLIASATSSVMLTDTEVWHGSLQVYLRTIAGTYNLNGSAGWHGNVLCLDYDNGIYLDYLGRVTQNGVVQGTLFPSGLQLGASITVQFVHTLAQAKANWPAGVTDAVTGSNVLTNPSFETNINGWTPHNGTVAQSTSHPHAGTQSLRITPNGTSAQCYVESTDQAPVTVAAGDRINVSGWVWCTNAVTTNFSMSVNWFDADDVYISTSTNYVSVAAATLTQITNTFTAPAGAAWGTIVPTLAGTPAAGQLWYLDDLSMTVTHNTGIPNITEFLVGKINNTVAGYLTLPAVATWTGTKRGPAGDSFNVAAGTRPDLPAYLLDTTFQAFNWAPDATYVATTSTAPTWDNVTEKGAITYDDLIEDFDVQPTLRARLVQKGVSSDLWEAERLSVFADPIIWSFSNDGGFTFTEALDIKNNPDGVMLFPPVITATNLNQKPGTSLVWRAVSYRPGSSIAALCIRPWYGGLVSGITHRPGLVPTGPNVNGYDQYGDIHNDSRFQTWNLPIPRDWWYQFQIIQRSQIVTPGTISVSTDQILLSQSLITNPGES